MPRPIRSLTTALLLVSIALPATAQSPSPRVQPAPGSPLPGASPSPAAPAIDPTAMLVWTRLDIDGPPAREDHTLSVDGTGSVAWLFGGRDGDRAMGDLWRLDLATDTWQRMDPPGERPAKRFGHAAVWLPSMGLVLFGGQAGSAFFDDLWAFDPVAGTWTELPGDGRRPEARYGTCAVVGPDGRLWVSHGFTASGRFGDTRAWDPASGRWTRETPAEGPAPVERCLHDCLWSPDGRLLLYGGQTTGVASLGDLWVLDPVSRQWRALPAPEPGERRLYALASDGSVAWLFGGADGRDRPLDDLWRWDLLTLEWERLTLPAEAARPAARSGSTLITDLARGRLLLFGGQDRDGRLGDLWVLSGEVPVPPGA